MCDGKIPSKTRRLNGIWEQRDMAGKPQTKATRPLQFESLEQRRVLAADFGSFHNVADPEDVNADGRRAVDDAFIAIRELQQNSQGDATRLVDVNADGRVTINDAMQVIRRLVTGGDTMIPVEQRINRLSDAIDSDSLPENFSPERAQRLLARLEEHIDTPASGEAGANTSVENPDVLIAENPDPQADGEFSEEAFRNRIEHRFEHLDANNDGSLSEDEISDFKWERLSEHDIEPDQLISVEEFTEAIESHWQEHRDRVGDRFDVFALFDRLDANSDGGITEDEFPSEHGWEHLIEADANNDNSLTEDELLDYAEQRANDGLDMLFQKLDADNDGQIGRDEVGFGWFWLRRADEDENNAISDVEWADTIGSIPTQIREHLEERRNA